MMASALHRCLCRAVVLTSANNTFKFQEDGGAPTLTATVAAGTYYVSGTGGSDDLLTALAAAMTTASVSGAGATYSLSTYRASSIGLIAWEIGIVNATSVAYIASGTTLPIDRIGITVAQDASFETELAPRSTVYGTWTADVISSVQDPGDLMGDGAYLYTRPDGSHVSGRTSQPFRVWPLLWEYVLKRRAWQRHETAATDWSWEQFWRAIHSGERLQLTEFVNVTSGLAAVTSVADGFLAQEARSSSGLSRDSDVPTYRIESTLVEDMTS